MNTRRHESQQSAFPTDAPANEVSPVWMDTQQYPFQPRHHQLKAGSMHYVDEGDGEVLLFVHGNPSWSFEYRHLIKGLRSRYRCVAPDHIGFGLSDKPTGPSYLPQFHAENMEEFISALDLTNITLVMQDWGGPIGLAYALRHPENVKRIVIANSWFWSARENRTLRIFSALVGGPIGRFLCRRFNFFPKVLLPASVGSRSHLPNGVLEHYIRPFDAPACRKGTWVFPGAIIGESQWLDGLWRQRHKLSHLPALFLWGMKDKAFNEPFLRRWQEAFPRSVAKRLAEIGHCVFEELGNEAIPPLSSFLGEQP